MYMLYNIASGVIENVSSLYAINQWISCFCAFSFHSQWICIQTGCEPYRLFRLVVVININAHEKIVYYNLVGGVHCQQMYN